MQTILFHRLFVLILLTPLISCKSLNSISTLKDDFNGIQILPLKGEPWSESVAKDWAQTICAGSIQDLSIYFISKNAPLDTNLIKKNGQQFCHIYYEPSIAGLKLVPDFGLAKEVFSTPDAKDLIFGEKKIWGNAYDISQYLKKALPETKHTRIVYDPQNNVEESNIIQLESEPMSWVRDYMIQGKVEDKDIFLIPHRLYEGRRDFGEKYKSSLDEITQKMPEARRSKLSWEGGDLVVIADPKDGSPIVVYGDTFKRYWGNKLDKGESDYILKREFGVKQTIHAGGVSSHVDYFMLPLDKNTVMVKESENKNKLILCDAAILLDNELKENSNATLDSVKALKLKLCNNSYKITSDLEDLIEKIESEIYSNDLPLNKDIRDDDLEKLKLFFTQLCPFEIGSKQLDECKKELYKKYNSPNGFALLKEFDRDLAEKVRNSDINGPHNVQRVQAIIELLQGQLKEIEVRKNHKEVLEQLTQLGYRVIKIPIPSTKSSWAGVSYVNSIVIDKKIFMPSFNLHSYEKDVHRRIKKQIPDYEIYFVPALTQITSNGGVHCSINLRR